MSVFNLETSLKRAERRLGARADRPGRKIRSDRGRSRIPAVVLNRLAVLCSTRERPKMRTLMRDIQVFCNAHALSIPSRATLYKLLPGLPVPAYRAGDLPQSVQDALYNQDPDTLVPGHQVAFYCFNYGNSRAVSFAAGLPWLALYQAVRLPGYRKKSLGLALAVSAAIGA